MSPFRLPLHGMVIFNFIILSELTILVPHGMYRQNVCREKMTMSNLTFKSGLWTTGLLVMGVLMMGGVKASEKSLLTAVRDGELASVQHLIAEGADLRAQGLDGSSALLLATRQNKVEMVW